MSSEQSTGNRSVSPSAVVDRLFAKLGAMYGRAWLDMWVGAPMDEVKAEWASWLHGVELDAVRLALDSLVAQGRAFPPTLPEFVSLCRQHRRKGAHRLALAAPRSDAPSNVFAALRRNFTDKGAA